MNDDELEKLIKRSVKEEEQTWTETIQNPSLDIINETISCRPIMQKNEKPIKLVSKDKSNTRGRKKDYSWMYLISLMLFLIGLYFLFLKYY